MNAHLTYLTQLIDGLKAKTAEQRAEALADACVLHGGCFSVGKLGGEITLLGTFGAGLSEAEACQNWIEAAERELKLRTKINAAENLLRDQDGTPDDITAACRYILSQSDFPGARLAASETLMHLNHGAAS